MALIDRLAARKVAFYFVERDSAALFGSHELMALAARWLKPGDIFSEAPDILPIWMGSYLPFTAAMERWAFPDVFAVVIGCPTAKYRRSLLAHIKRYPPIGMFDTDSVADSLDLPLVLHGFVLPQAVLRLNSRGRHVERETGLDVIGLDTDDEEMAFDFAIDSVPGDAPIDLLEETLLKCLANGAGRSVPDVRATAGFDALVDHAFELFGLGATVAAGLVAGVAFEQLMRASLSSADLVWLRSHEAVKPVTLNDIVGKVASSRRVDDGRLRNYQRLRNDLAHRLGDLPTQTREDGALREAIDELLRWLNEQGIGEDGRAVPLHIAPDPALTNEDLLREARSAGQAAGLAATTTIVALGGARFEPFGFAWVTVRDKQRPFTRWLLESGNASPVKDGARIGAPEQAFERNLAWAHACAMRLRAAGYAVDYAGRPD
jgi:hypothetical protein